MKKAARLVLLSSAAIIVAAFLLFALCSQPSAVRVRVAAAVTKNIYNSITTSGTIEAQQAVYYLPRQGAVVDKLYTAVGEEIQEGEALFGLRAVDADAESTSVLQSALLLAEYLAAENREAVYMSAGTVCARKSGTVIALPETGAYLPAGLPAAQTVDTGRLQARILIPEGYISSVSSGQKANITADSAPDKTFSAYVQSIAPTAVKSAFSITGETKTASVSAILPLQQRADVLRPGCSVHARIFTEYHQNAILVPYEAVTQRGEQECVFTMENGRAILKTVETGFLLDQACEIKSGLEENAVIILSPPESLQSGETVEVNDA